MLRIGSFLILLLVPAFVLADEKEKPKPSMIGVQIATGSDESTIVIRLVINNGPAEKAGLKSGDILKRINGIKADKLSTTVQAIRSLTPGKKVKFLIERDGKEKTIEVTPMAADG
jgi:S1-C subfamily serine protease